MASLSGLLHRPLSAAAVVAAAAVTSADLHDRLSIQKPAESSLVQPVATPAAAPEPSGLPGISGSFFSSRLQPPIDRGFDIRRLASEPSTHSVAALPVLRTVHHYAKFAKADEPAPAVGLSQSDVPYRWHLPDPRAYMVSGVDDCSLAKSRTVIVLLGWLGAKQRHLRRYAEWYTSRGYHAVTFTFPMTDVVSYKVGGKAEQIVESLAEHLAEWAEESGRKIIFHTFSNTGWLTYGAILEKLRKQGDPTAMDKIKGCVVDSAPVATVDPHVFASGFSAAFLKKNSVAAKGTNLGDSRTGMLVLASEGGGAKPGAAEVILLSVLDMFFEVVLSLPAINRRLSDVLEVLAMEQPKCPQLYMYSSADRVIPAEAVESFVDTQRKAGRNVRACNFVSSPHVDHFRSQPELYSAQLGQFLEDCVLTCCCKGSH